MLTHAHTFFRQELKDCNGMTRQAGEEWLMRKVLLRIHRQNKYVYRTNMCNLSCFLVCMYVCMHACMYACMWI